MLQKIAPSFYLITLSAFVIGCGAKEQTITKTEAIAFGKKLELSLKKGSTKVYDSIFHIRSFAGKVAKESGMKLNSDYYRGVADALKRNDLGKMIISKIKDGSYDLLRQYQKGDRQHVVFRFFQGDGINYHDYELVKFADKVQVSDLYDFITGQNFTKIVADVMITMDGYSKNNDMALKNSVKQMMEIKKLMREAKYAEAKKEYDGLPAIYKKEKIFQSMHLQITSELDEEIYKEALNDYEQLYANDPSSQFALIDAYILNKQFDKVIRAFNKIDSAVGGDPFLNYYRALIYSQKGEEDKAVKYLEVLHKDFPDFADGSLELIAKYINVKDHDKAKDLIVSFKSNKKFDQSKLLNIKILYPEFSADYDF